MYHGSLPFSLDSQDVRKILKGAAIAAAGCALPYAAQLVGSIDDSTTAGAVLAALGAALVNVARKFLADNRDH